MIRKPDNCRGDLSNLPLIKDNQASASSHSIDLDLSKVRSFEKRQELFNTLHSAHPDHYSRLYLVGFLKFVGYSLDEVCAIIENEASWEDYDRTMTYCQVRSVFKPGGVDNREATDISLQVLSLPSFLSSSKKESGNTDGYAPKICIIGDTRITCHFKKCDLCKLKVQE